VEPTVSPSVSVSPSTTVSVSATPNQSQTPNQTNPQTPNPTASNTPPTAIPSPTPTCPGMGYAPIYTPYTQFNQTWAATKMPTNNTTTGPNKLANGN
jgi:hypothetical protein